MSASCSAPRIVRLFAYGSLSVMLGLYLAAVGLSDPQIGLLLTLTLVGDTVVSLVADDAGRPFRTPANAAHRGPADGGRRAGLRRLRRLPRAPDGGHYRRHQPQRH